MRKFFFFFPGSLKFLQHKKMGRDVRTDEVVETMTDGESTEREDITTTLDTSHSQDETGQHKGGEQREKVSEVESESRAVGVSACDDCVGVFQFFSHLIFGPFVQGFSVFLSLWGVLIYALPSPALCGVHVLRVVCV